MTTRAGFIGLLTGLAATMILVQPFAISRHAVYTRWDWFAILMASIVTLGGGTLTGIWSGAVHPARRAVLGGLAGGLAGVIVFCLLGAACAGLSISTPTQVAFIIMTVQRTQVTFLGLFLGGIALGAFGGWLAHPGKGKEIFDKTEPQMAMNAAITAVPASIFAGIVSILVFSSLADSIGKDSLLDMPLTASLLLVLLSHLALTLVLPHEAHEAEHVCGMNEVKMTAFVGIGAAPVLTLSLSLIDIGLFLKPQVAPALLAGMIMSLRSLQLLLKVILPARASRFRRMKSKRSRQNCSGQLRIQMDHAWLSSALAAG